MLKKWKKRLFRMMQIPHEIVFNLLHLEHDTTFEQTILSAISQTTIRIRTFRNIQISGNEKFRS